MKPKPIPTKIKRKCPELDELVKVAISRRDCVVCGHAFDQDHGNCRIVLAQRAAKKQL